MHELPSLPEVLKKHFLPLNSEDIFTSNYSQLVSQVTSSGDDMVSDLNHVSETTEN